MNTTKSGAQRGARMVFADPAGCESCVHFARQTLFEICTHAQSQYRIAEDQDFHTTHHMRDHFVGLCGEEKRLYSPVVDHRNVIAMPERAATI